MLYTVNVMGQSLFVAAIIINLLHSLSGVFVLLFAWIAEAYTDSFNVIVFSTSSYTMGLIMLWITAWPSAEFSMFYVAMILIGIGKSGQCSILQSFLGCQLRERKDATGERRQREVGPKIWWHSAWISGYVMALLALGHGTWRATFKISALLMGGTCFTFYSGFFCYHNEEPTRKSLANILRIFKAATSNRFLLWVAFFPYGLVWATANTLFIVQTGNRSMQIANRSLIPATFFFVLKSIISDIVVFLFWLRATPKGIPLVRIGAGMVFAVFSCVAARQNQLHMLHSVSSISILWLVPQYFLLGLMEGFAGGGLNMFFHAHLHKSMKSFAEPFSELVLCVGKFSSIFFLLIINASFDNAINNKYFDRYFLILAILCSVLFCLYFACSLCYENSEMEDSYAMEAGNETGQEAQEGMNGDQAEEEPLPEYLDTGLEFLQPKVEELKEQEDDQETMEDGKK